MLRLKSGDVFRFTTDGSTIRKSPRLWIYLESASNKTEVSLIEISKKYVWTYSDKHRITTLVEKHRNQNTLEYLGNVQENILEFARGLLE